jgi:hypothetical protein
VIDERRTVTLSKAESETPAGRELLALLTELSADGVVSRPEMDRLRTWLEVDHGVEFPALSFLHETIEQISVDGEITEDELDRLALAIERVLPKQVRFAAVEKRKHAREARRVAERETRRAAMLAARAEAKGRRATERARNSVLYEARFVVRGAFRTSERREACEGLLEGDDLTLEREAENVHDANAVLVLSADDRELGYVPREEALALAPFIDAGATPEAIVSKLWETPDDGHVVPIVKVKIRRGESGLPPALPRMRARSVGVTSTDPKAARNRPGCGCAGAAVSMVVVMLVVALITLL